MPVPRMQRREERLKYVVVERTEDNQAREVDSSREASSPTPTSFVDLPNDEAQPHPTLLRIRNDDDDDDRGRGPPPVWTLTVMGAQSTGGALAADDPRETVVVAIPPPPRPDDRDGGGGNHKGGISQTTEHLLIAAGSIGATIIIVMIVLAIYTLRKRGLTLAQALKHGKHQVANHRNPPPPPKFEGDWDAKQSFSNEYGTLRANTVTPPQATVARSGSSSSRRPPMALDRSDSFNLQAQRKPSADTQGTSFLLESPPPRRNNSNRRAPSATPESPILGQQPGLRNSASTRNTHSIPDDASELIYNDPPPKPIQSPLPPPPTFKQFLNNRPSISGKAGFGGMMSRFSWTNSNAPQTPHDPNRDTYQAGRESYMTTRSSVPRFRTVDSWVNQQTNRLEAQKLKEQFRLTSTSTVYSADEENDRVPEVPAMPKNVEQLRESSANISASLPLRAPATPPLPIPKGLPGKNIRHERHDTRTTVDTAPIFKQHPGTEVRFSSRSAVPSEILDRGRNPSVLS